MRLQNATPLRKPAPWPPNISDEHVACTAPATRHASSQILTPANVVATATKGAESLLCLPHETASERPKMVRDSQFVTLLTSKCASRHNTFWTSQLPKVLRRWGVLHILTRKRASRHNGVHFSTSQLPRVPRRWNVFLDVFSILAWKCASRHNGVQIFISHLRPAALASLLFDPSEPQNIGKTECFATFLPFRAPASSFFWLFLFSDLLSSSLLFSSFLFSSLLWLFPHLLFHLSILSEVWLLNFLRLRYVKIMKHLKDRPSAQQRAKPYDPQGISTCLWENWWCPLGGVQRNQNSKNIVKRRKAGWKQKNLGNSGNKWFWLSGNGWLRQDLARIERHDITARSLSNLAKSAQKAPLQSL